MDSCGDGGCSVISSLFRVTATDYRFRNLFPDHALNHSLVAANLEPADKHRLRTSICGRPVKQKISPMKQAITGFEKDDEGHWRAILDCGHRQHVRHDPPLTERSWVLTQEGRDSRLGLELDCKRCDEEPPLQ
jgi:uncharacterized protein DUF3565